MPQVSGLPSGEYLQRLIQGLQSQVGALATQQGLTVVDSKLRVRVQIGLLSNGDYGLLLTDTAGNTQEVLPTVHAYRNTVISMTGYGPSTLAGSPSVTATIGQSGNALVTVSAFVQCPSVAGSTSGGIYLNVDGGANYGGAGVSGSGPYVAGTCTTTYDVKLLTGAALTPGSHTFSLSYYANSGSPSNVTNFSLTSLIVQPV